MALISHEKTVSFLGRTALLFFFLYMSTLSIDYFVFGVLIDWVSEPFLWLAEFTGHLFFSVTLVDADAFHSDSLVVYVHLFNLLIIALLASAVWTFRTQKKFSETNFYPLLFTLLRYFVAFNMFVYGFAKLYKWQFMLPEPNTLFTRVGEMHRDILYWTSMGTSRSYSIFMGIIEIVPGVLLLFRRTALVGALITAFVLMNVVAVNFGFDIMVKLHSMTLLLMTLVLLIPGWKRIAALFTGQPTGPFQYPALTFSWKQRWIAPALKIAVIGVLLYEMHYPYTASLNFNDDAAERPPMHGAYEVFEAREVSGGALFETYRIHSPVKRIFFHRRGYIIFQMDDGEMIDYPMLIDTAAHKVAYGNDPASQRTFQWKELGNDSVKFSGEFEQTGYMILKLQRLDLSKLPLMQEEFSWLDEK